MDGFFYVVARDFGFAPNPFHGTCTLATCKPTIRRVASVGDWIFGIGGRRLKAAGRLIFAMEVAETMTFNEYWEDPRFRAKRPVRNGSRKMLLGDNIYHSDPESGPWIQEDSHHSRPDGTPNPDNVTHDTQTDRVLVGFPFYYFGRGAPVIPPDLLIALRYSNGQGHRRRSLDECRDLLQWLHTNHGRSINYVSADPFEFAAGERRYSISEDRVT